MNIVKKIISFLKLSFDTKLLFIEAFLLLGWARILKLIPFSKLAPALGTHMEETPYSLIDLDKKQIRKVSTAIHVMSRYTFWESQCLVKAIAGMKMLRRRKIESTLYLGTARDENGKMIAHAWLRSGPIYISGAEGMEKFTVVSIFAKKVNRKEHERYDKMV
ncbi:lasso peptide biosynthesis B2 protein [Fredinandcohnia quinoae]|uniref:Lasso peptide biosynthesis B2 protein n=1 Tax=Fredinandcohnia quinoae TaxID=2918902 RepID=A0AAW5E284_9BACI|nr:lasso peptide biosynthesis B2 protein [Fredinandcohnia sp. SECRCQ15]MCH1624874.1 lasso peptide biosynthesis B2 protein [Fredinandcohnia sp. SECRCQ15]